MSRCYICDRILSTDEVQWNRDHEDWDPCGTCLDVINNLFEHPDEEEIDRQLSLELFYEEMFENNNRHLDDDTTSISEIT